MVKRWRVAGPALSALLGIAIPGAALAADPRCARVAGMEPPAGLVATASVAAQVARTYLDAAYGAAAIRAQRPLRATLEDGVWTVTGTLPSGTVGGTARLTLCRRNGAVLTLFRTQ